MKKLMFAAAIAASAAAFATPINAISFESDQYASIDNATNLNARADIPDPGRTDTGTYFLYQGEGSDSSIVTNVGAAFTDGKVTGYYSGLESYSNQKYLALDTEGGTLWRSINTLGTDALGEAKAVAATGTYLDTLVQFTVTEDEAPAVGADDKLAIWLQAGEGTTNLMVKAGYYDASGTFVSGGTNFVLSGVTVQPGTWYRLTVKAIDDVVDSTSEFASLYKLPVFTIQIDGTYLTATEATLPSEYTLGLGASGILTQDTVSEFNNGKYFLNLLQGTPGTATTLQGVGFQGTGAVDEIVWTEDDPFPAATVEFTLTYTAGDANVTLGAVTYTVGEDPAQTVTSGGKVPEGATVSIAATFAEGYQLAAVTTNGAAVAGATLPYTFTMTADMTVAITSEAEPVANPTVDGQTVEPANVFNTAASNKPIIYPSAPTIAGEVGSQTITFNGTTVSVPAYYTATLDGTTVTLALNDNALPTIGDEAVSGEAKDAIEVGATTFTATLTSTNEKLYYGLKSAATVNAAAADWTVGTLTKGTGAPMQITADKPTVNENAASAGFFKVYVTDVPPAAEPVVEP